MNSTAGFSPSYLAVDKGYVLKDISLFFTLEVTLFIVLFFVARILQKTAKGPDIWLMGFGYLVYMGLLTVAYIQVEMGGSGEHVVAILLKDPQKLVIWHKLEVSVLYITLVTVTLPRLAILCLYLKIIKNPFYRRIAYGTGVFAVVYALSFMLTTSVICVPFSRWWKDETQGHCGNVPMAIKASTVPNVVIDLVMLFLPLPSIWKLQTSRMQKIGLILTFLAGSTGTLFAFIKLAYFFTVDLAPDPTYWSVTWMTWNIVESGMYLVAATFPSLRSLPRNLRQRNTFGMLRSTNTNAMKFPSGSSTDSVDEHGQIRETHIIELRTVHPAANLAQQTEEGLPTMSSMYAQLNAGQADTERLGSVIERPAELDVERVISERQSIPEEHSIEQHDISPISAADRV